MSGYQYEATMQLGDDPTVYRKLSGDHVRLLPVEGRQILQVDPEALCLLAREALKDVIFLPRTSHLEKVAAILGSLDRWERRSLGLAVFLDEPATDLADTLLHPLFAYAFVKGLALARFGEDAGGDLAADHWLRTIPPAVDVLSRQAALRGVPLPVGDVEAIIAVGRE